MCKRVTVQSRSTHTTYDKDNFNLQDVTKQTNIKGKIQLITHLLKFI